MLFFFSDLQNMVIATPMIARNGENVLGLMSVIRKDCPSIAFRDRTHAVIVVPRLEPMIRLIALLSSIIPELTRPTERTVIAEEDCTIAVTSVPNRNAKNQLFVSFPIKRLSAPPVSIVRESLSLFIPARNSASPANIEVTIIKASTKVMSIEFLSEYNRYYPYKKYNIPNGKNTQPFVETGRTT